MIDFMPDTEDLELKPEATQFAALAFDLSGDEPRYLIVTSRRTGRWIFPKGSAESGEDGWQTAAREAREEAGVVGVGLPQEIGRYRSLKIRENWMQPLDVRLFPVRIEKMEAEWDEIEARDRRLASIDEVQSTLSQPEMADLCGRFHRSLQSR